MRFKSIRDAIGNTPVVEIAALSTPWAPVLAKLEGMNPTGSVKDRCALYLVREAEQRGSLAGKILVDASSGNFGTAVAMLAKTAGAHALLMVPPTLTTEKQRSMEIFGAKLVRVPGSSLEGARLAAEMAKDDKRFVFLDQFHSSVNITAHYETTGAEILRDVPDVAAYVCAMASGGSLIGVARRLRTSGIRPQIHAVTAESGSRIPGLRNTAEDGEYPPLVNMSEVDEEHRVSLERARAFALGEAAQSGLLLGLSGGAVLGVAAELARSGRVRGPIVALCADTSLKYITGALAPETATPLSALA